MKSGLKSFLHNFSQMFISWIDIGDNKGAENTENTISKILTQDAFLHDYSESNLRDVTHFGSTRHKLWHWDGDKP